MTELPYKWQSLPVHQKIKYLAELIAICGGLFLLILNAYQLKLMAQQNAINYEILKSTFPIEIESALIDYTDRKPLVLKVKLTNVVNQTVYLQTLIPKFVLSNSDEIKSGLSEIETKIYKQNSTNIISSPYAEEQKVILKPYESCILELTINLKTNDAYHDKHMSKFNPELASFIIIPIALRGPEQETSRTLSVSLARDKNKHLLVSSNISRITDNKILLEDIKFKRAIVGFRMRDPADIPDNKMKPSTIF